MRTTVKLSFRLLPLLLISLFESGCCARALWANGNLDAYKEPAPSPNLRLFASPKTNDFLVVYSEYSERSDSVRTRAYWLNKNENRVENEHAPVFTRKNLTDHLLQVPVFYYPLGETNLNQSLYAVCDTNMDTFKLYSDNYEIGSYCLPYYKDRQGTIEKVALTPVTVTADTSIAGGYVGFILLYEWAQGGQSFQVGK